MAMIVFVVWVVAWFIAVLWVFSVGEPEPREGFPFVTEVKWDSKTRYIFFY